eukprot:4777499-Alexandrium_andersonii.AAC.1
MASVVRPAPDVRGGRDRGHPVEAKQAPQAHHPNRRRLELGAAPERLPTPPRHTADHAPHRRIMPLL